MKIAALIPDRNDRPLFLQNCLRMIEAQTVKVDVVNLVNYEPLSDAVDITQRYKKGYDELRGLGIDLIFLFENDDQYSPDYIETMLAYWELHGKPDLFGTAYTIYYHIELRAWFKMEHHQRASAMNTVIRADLNFPWCVDHEPFTDLHLWSMGSPGAGIQSRVVFLPTKVISIGIKHGVGKTIPGGSHVIEPRMIPRYANLDPDFEFLKENMDEESFKFYSTYFNK